MRRSDFEEANVARVFVVTSLDHRRAVYHYARNGNQRAAAK
jgi:hypothetical protein